MTVKTLTRMLEEYFAAGSLPASEKAKYYLICRYQDKVSKRLLDEREALYQKGKQLSDEMFKKELMRPLSETLFGSLPKQEGIGFYAPVPLGFPR